MKNYSDEQLIVDYLKGDKEALEILIKRYLKSIYSFVYHFGGNNQEVEDITQEVFVKVWRNLKRFDRNKKFKTWIFTIAKNTCFDWQKKKRTVPFSVLDNEGELSFAETIKDPAPLPNELLEKQDINIKLNKAVESLSPKYNMILLLRYNHHFTFREIAESLEESINTVKSRHRRALVTLKKLLSEH
jgi:RNA polymerase sigma-70 factor (ECF subfamily)